MNNVDIIKQVREAIENEERELLSRLFGENPEILNMKTIFGTWLHVAVDFEKFEMLKHLVALGVNINERAGIFDAGPLKLAASEGNYEMVAYLLDQGAELDVSEPERNPLFAAIYCGRLDIVKLLIEHGIDPHVKYDSLKRGGEMTALTFARERTSPAAWLAEQLK